MGWWRRNRWGLVALVPAAAAVLALGAESVRFQQALLPTEQVAPDPDGFSTLELGRVRLVSITPITEVKSHQGEPMRLPSTVAIWRATVDIQVKPEAYFGGCDIRLEDEQGRTYRDDVSTLLPDAALSSGGCLDRSASGELPAYTAEAIFAMPAGARPVAVRIFTQSSLPRYARLTR